MKIKFSKSLNSIKNEMTNILESDKKLLSFQNQNINTQSNEKLRVKCILCSTLLKNSDIFLHRTIEYIKCSKCGHIQQKYILNSLKNDVDFSKVYPPLSKKEYLSRTHRIYMPKLKWILNEFKTNNFLKNFDIKTQKWIEIGCGAGYFLKALSLKGIDNICGIDSDKFFIKRSLKKDKLENRMFYSSNPAKYIKKNNAEIYAAFFVLEHLKNPINIFKALSEKPKNTFFVFSVPVFSLSTVLETIFENYYARNLDGIVHTNLFTDSSIKYCLDFSGYEIISEWMFGQDSSDFSRLVLTYAKEKFSLNIYNDVFEKINSIANDFQKVIDKNSFCDARHILAIKT